MFNIIWNHDLCRIFSKKKTRRAVKVKATGKHRKDQRRVRNGQALTQTITVRVIEKINRRST